jgi:hypothetical protein
VKLVIGIVRPERAILVVPEDDGRIGVPVADPG